MLIVYAWCTVVIALIALRLFRNLLAPKVIRSYDRAIHFVSVFSNPTNLDKHKFCL